MKNMIILIILSVTILSCSKSNDKSTTVLEEASITMLPIEKDTMITLYSIIDSVASMFGKKYNIGDYVINEFIQMPKNDSIHLSFLYDEYSDTIYITYVIREEDFYIRYAIWNKKNYISGSLDSCECMIETLLKEELEKWDTSKLVFPIYFATNPRYHYSARAIIKKNEYTIETIKYEYYDDRYKYLWNY